MYKQAGDNFKTIEMCEKALNHNPNNWKAMRFRAFTNIEKAKKIDVEQTFYKLEMLKSANQDCLLAIQYCPDETNLDDTLSLIQKMKS